MVSGWAMRLPRVVRWVTTTRRWASRRAAPGSRSSGTSAGWAWTRKAQPFTVAGIGDMSGDVFGNGMLLSEQIKLVLAFDHRHVFIDPSPDVATSFAERQRLFNLPRSSWDDYDKSLISEGGGVFPRSAKSIPLSAQARAVLGTDAKAMAPNELLNAILKAPVDLLYNGGIGTYVKASFESHAQAGDKAGDAFRVNGNELRCKVLGEGGNLGATQNGRIEFAQAGGLIYTDAIDNSAGVDCSDHEVNIKILVGAVQESGALTQEERNELLASMTDEVGLLVLQDNYYQSQQIELAAARPVYLLEGQKTSCAGWRALACSSGASSTCPPTKRWPNASAKARD